MSEADRLTELDASLLPATAAQERLWLAERFADDHAVYPVPVRVDLRGPLHVPTLRNALGRCVARHEALRTGFDTVDGRPHQVIVDPPGPTVPVPVTDLRQLPPHRRAERARELADAQHRRPFAPTELPLLRARLLRLDTRHHELCLTVHHTVCDGSSVEQLVDELLTGYAAAVAGTPDPVPEPRVGLAEWTERRLALAGSPAARADLDHWRRRLAGVPPVLELPTDRPRPRTAPGLAAVHRFAVGSPLLPRLRELSRACGVSLFGTLLGGLAALLHRYTRQPDLCVGVPVTLRDSPDLHRTLGPLLNTVAVRLTATGSTTTRELLIATGRAVREAMAHGAVPFEHVVDALDLPGVPGVTPLFQVMFSHERVGTRRWRFGDLTATAEILAYPFARTDLVVAVEESDTRLDGRLEYRADIFDAERMARLAGHYTTLLAAAAREPDRPVATLPLLTAGERALVLDAWNDTAVPFPDSATVAGLFAEQVRRAPDAPAIHTGGVATSYRELNRRANRIAAALTDLGVGPEVVVGVCLPRSVDAVAALLGVLKAGGGYLPLDPGHPPRRLAALVDDVAAPVVLTDLAHADRVTGGGARLLLLDDPAAGLDRLPADDPPRRGGPESLAYVIHTSGSTGTPNGVAVAQRALVARVREVTYGHFGPGQTVLHLASLAFDASVTEVWAPLLNGGALAVPAPDQPFLDQVREGITRNPVTVVQLVSPQLPLVLDGAPELLDGVERVLVGGDLMSPRHAAALLARRDPERFTFVHLYGPTECTLMATCERVTHVDPDAPSVPVGRPLPNTRVYVLSPELVPVPVGVPGEVVIAGAGLARGYRGRPAATARRFRPDPFGPPGSRMYRTGDLGRFLPDGRIEFLGRIDRQVKIRGFRIETGEVEAALAGHPAVAAAVVTVRDDLPGGRGLAGYLVPADPDAPPDPDAVREHLRAILPGHMVPAGFVVLPRLPLTGNGKVDRAALPPVGLTVEPVDRAARTPVERQLARLWAEALEVPDVPTGADFFDIGGNSLRVTRLFDLIEKTWPGRLRLAELLELGTVRRQARVLRDRIGPAVAPAAAASDVRGDRS
ncbi:amino acid adenylation domain-containing protein [Micromonospora sp. NPDC050187]|uniref:amino acid adenylation domain-containing protein n=1 Tax=Micromonospora sp. NPDC050187 TaxID=3364277 RepID=UPI00378B4EA8